MLIYWDSGKKCIFLVFLGYISFIYFHLFILISKWAECPFCSHSCHKMKEAISTSQYSDRDTHDILMQALPVENDENTTRAKMCISKNSWNIWGYEWLQPKLNLGADIIFLGFILFLLTPWLFFTPYWLHSDIYIMLSSPDHRKDTLPFQVSLSISEWNLVFTTWVICFP